MLKTVRTPGPWSLLPARTLINVKGPEGEQVTQIPKEEEANARLIAAAPDLIGLAKHIRNYCDIHGSAEDPELQELSEAARAAIDKAEGGS